jgi:diguanylate cyclase (GGDEF)-like protein
MMHHRRAIQGIGPRKNSPKSAAGGGKSHARLGTRFVKEGTAVPFKPPTHAMRPAKVSSPGGRPQTRQELEAWIRHLRLPRAIELSLITAVDSVLARNERLWQQSKQEAIQALSAGFAERMVRARRELSDKEAAVRSISSYFEHVVADLTDRSQRDPKTKLINFDRFNEQLESFLALEQRGTWCAVGLVDINGFKWYNDALGHAVGDRIIERVAQLLREKVRSDDIIAQERSSPKGKDLHARFGGDEFCFLIPNLDESHEAFAIAERFREAVERFDWTIEDPRLAARAVRVDVGVVCLWLGQVADRQPYAQRLAGELVRRADLLMYEAKGRKAERIFLGRVRVEHNDLVELADTNPSVEARDRRA